MIQTIPLSLETLEAAGYQNQRKYRYERAAGLYEVTYNNAKPYMDIDIVQWV